jgi:predicted AAA+ superfamily ATPase
MNYLPRIIAKQITQTVQRGKSVLLLGPRQTGKTTLIQQEIQPDISYSFVHAHIRQRYEQNHALLEKELQEQLKQYTQPPLIFIDEIQKIPRVMDIVQHLIDSKSAQFILTGSSARKLKSGQDINLLPGRVVALTMPPLLYDELPDPKPTLEDLLLYGTLPGIITEPNINDRETDLYSYVNTYLEDEVRSEALVRNVGSFARFLEIAASESGKQLNFTRLSQDIGISDTTVANFYHILEDCLIIQRIDPITDNKTKRRLTRSLKYLFFDLGIRRACAHEGTRLPQKVLGDLFEHAVGNALVYYSQITSPGITVKYWRDAAGPEIDFVLDIMHQYIPIEVKWSDKPNDSDAKHLKKFLNEYAATRAYIICRSPNTYQLSDKITVLSWKELPSIFQNITTSIIG